MDLQPRNYVVDGRAMLNMAGEIASSRVNGPGDRYVLWMQFCPMGCRGCFNPETWSDRAVELTSPTDLGLRILMSGSSGLTISGGEPFSQPVALLELLRFIHDEADPLRPRFPDGIICFSGYELEVLEADPLCCEIMSYCDLVVAGPYVQELRSDIGIGGSTNKRFWYNPYHLRGKQLIDSANVEFDRGVEIHDSADGVLITGFPDLDRAGLRKLGLRVS